MTSINDKKKILGYKPIKPTITKTPSNKIKPPPIQDRFNSSVEDDLTVDQIEETPLPALYCPPTGEFFVVEMLDILTEGIKRKVKEFTLFVIGEIEQPDDSASFDSFTWYQPANSHVIKFLDPDTLTPLPKKQGLHPLDNLRTVTAKFNGLFDYLLGRFHPPNPSL